MVKTWYGLGWRVFDAGTHHHFVHHGGWVQGYRAEMVFNRELNIGMVFLTNAETRLARDVIFAFVNAYETERQQPLLTSAAAQQP
jgi:beta-lactamase class C